MKQNLAGFARRAFMALMVSGFVVSCTERQRLTIAQNFRHYTGRDTYLGTIYPNKFELSVSRDIGWFTTLEACRAASLKELVLIRAPYPDVGDYECGLNCGSLSDWPSMWVCMDTLH